MGIQYGRLKELSIFRKSLDGSSKQWRTVKNWITFVVGQGVPSPLDVYQYHL